MQRRRRPTLRAAARRRRSSWRAGWSTRRTRPCAAIADPGRRDRPLRLQAGPRRAAAVGLPRRHARRPRGRRVPGLRRPPAGTWCRRPCCATARSAPGACQLWIDEPEEAEPLVGFVPAGELPPRLVPDRRGARRRRPRRTPWPTPTTRGWPGWRSSTRCVNNADRKGGHVLARRRRPDLRRRPRRLLPRRGQAAHGAVGLGRPTAAGGRACEVLDAAAPRSSTGAARRGAGRAPDRGEVAATAAADRPAAAPTGAFPQPAAGLAGDALAADVSAVTLVAHGRVSARRCVRLAAWNPGSARRCRGCPAAGEPLALFDSARRACRTRPRPGRRRHACTSAASPRTTRPTSATPPP